MLQEPEISAGPDRKQTSPIFLPNKFGISYLFLFCMQEDGIEPIVFTLEVGEYARIVYKPTADDFAVSAYKFGIWKKNNLDIKKTTGNVVVGMKKKKNTAVWLKIKNVGIQDAGLYSFMINCTVVKQWLLRVKGDFDFDDSMFWLLYRIC